MPQKYSKILVTGGAGFIGSHLVDRLLVDGFKVTVIDNLSSGVAQNISPHDGEKNFHLMRGDIDRLELVKKAVKGVDAVFHEAAVLTWTGSLKSLLHLNQVNVNGTLNLLNACADSNVKRFVYASSAAVYGEADVQPQSEDLNPKPISPYGVSKLSAEHYVQVFHNLYGLETVCLRYFNVYGPRQTCGPYSGVMTKFMSRLSKNEPPIIYGDGEQTRDFVSIKDVVEANMLALTTESAVGEVFNIGTGVATRINELAKTLQEIMGQKSVKPLHASLRPTDLVHSCASISKARKDLRHNPQVSIRSGLREFVKYFRG